MQNPVRVEIVPRTVEADNETRAHRAQTVQRLAELGQLDHPESGEVGSAMQDGWMARINGAEVPVTVFAVEQDETGRPVLLLQIRPDSLTIGDPSLGEQSRSGVAAPEVKPLSSWGSPGPDPRESIPDWKPETLNEQGTGNAECQAHDHTLAKWTCGCDPVLTGIRDAAQATGNISVMTLGGRP